MSEVKKETVKKTQTKKTTKKVEEKIKDSEVVEKKLTVDDIPQELMMEMFKKFQQMQEVNAVESESTATNPKDKKPEKITKAYLRRIKDREIVVKSIAGIVTFKSPKTSTLYQWFEAGDEEIMTMDEILTMDSISKRFLETPWLSIEDEEVIEGLGLTELYSLIEQLRNIDELIEKDFSEIERLVNKAPYEYKRSLSNEVFAKVLSNEIRDIVLIRNLEGLLGTTFLL